MEVYFGVQVRPRGSLKDVLQNSWKVMCTREMLRDKLEDKVNKNIFKKKRYLSAGVILSANNPLPRGTTIILQILFISYVQNRKYYISWYIF